MAESDTTEIASAARKYWSAEGYTEGGVIREVDYAAQSGGLDPMFAGIKIVDTDTHITVALDPQAPLTQSMIVEVTPKWRTLMAK